MAKQKELRLAKIYYVEHGKTAKECARLAGVTEKTVGKWADLYGWKKQRDAIANSLNGRIENIKEILSLCAEERLELSKELKKAIQSGEKEEAKMIRATMASIGDEVSKWNKALENLEKSNKITLEVYLNVMEDIFKGVQAYDPKLFVNLLDFQESHVHIVSVKLG